MNRKIPNTIPTRLTSQDGKPEPVLHDSNGIKIVPKLRIAYNLGGAVKIGYVKELIRSEWKPSYSDSYSLKFELKVISQDNSDTITIIKNPNSFVVV